MTYDEKLDLILARLDAIEAKLGASAPPIEVPAPTGGLYDFVRPVPVEPRHGAGVRMTSPDAAEALLRSKYAVRWNGDVMLTGAAEDKVWAEIEALKAGDEKLIAKYRVLDPTFAGFALLPRSSTPPSSTGSWGRASATPSPGTPSSGSSGSSSASTPSRAATSEMAADGYVGRRGRERAVEHSSADADASSDRAASADCRSTAYLDAILSGDLDAIAAAACGVQ